MVEKPLVRKGSADWIAIWQTKMIGSEGNDQAKPALTLNE